MLVDVQVRKESRQNTLRVGSSEVFGRAGRQSPVRSTPGASLLLASASSVAHLQSIADLSICLGESRGPPRTSRCSQHARPTFFGACAWRSTFRRFHPSSVVVSVQALPRAWPQCLDGFCLSFVPTVKGCFSRWASWSAIARPTRRAAPQATSQSRSAIDQLTSRLSPVLHKRTSCWLSRQPLGSPSHWGRFIRSPLGSVMSLEHDFEFSASFAVNLAGILNPARLPLWNTRVLDDNVRQVCDTCARTKAKPKAVVQVMKCTCVQEDTTGIVRAKCAHVGNRSTEMSSRAKDHL